MGCREVLTTGLGLVLLGSGIPPTHPFVGCARRQWRDWSARGGVRGSCVAAEVAGAVRRPKDAVRTHRSVASPLCKRIRGRKALTGWWLASQGSTEAAKLGSDLRVSFEHSQLPCGGRCSRSTNPASLHGFAGRSGLDRRFGAHLARCNFEPEVTERQRYGSHNASLEKHSSNRSAGPPKQKVLP